MDLEILRALQPSNRMYKEYVVRQTEFKKLYGKDTKKIMEMMVETDADNFHQKFYSRVASNKALVGDKCELTKPWECGSNCCAIDDTAALPTQPYC